jgi:probable phosphoglycerate mutase
MKTVYLIRHGQSEGNLGVVRQGPETPLTELGITQAHIMAERCAQFPIEVLFSSTMKRAQNTAEIIGEKIGKERISSSLFMERNWPSVLIGKETKSPEVQKIRDELVANFSVPNYRYSDEENFTDLKVRAKKALEFIEAREEEHVAIVMHAYFMKVFAAYVVFGETLTADMCHAFIRGYTVENTGLSVLKKGEFDTGSGWKVWVWNDHTHLS